MTTSATHDPRGHCRVVDGGQPATDADSDLARPGPDPAAQSSAGESPAGEHIPYHPQGAESLDDALDQLLGAYTESRLEQIAYPDTLTSRGWRFALRYMAVVIAGEKGISAIKKIDESYPMTSEPSDPSERCRACGQDHMSAINTSTSIPYTATPGNGYVAPSQ